MPTVGETGERALIRRIRARVPSAPDWLLVGIGDDAAVMVPERNRVEVATTDACVEGIHFDRRYVPPAAIGHRALAVNLSDLAAMGAEPRAALLSLILPADTSVSDLDSLLDGMLELAARHGVTLAGGNISRSPGPLVVDVTALGTMKRRDIMLRKGARPGHAIYMSGVVGASRAGFLSLRDGSPAAGDLEEARARFLTPEPRLRLGQLLARNRIASACVDLSDGLADGVTQIARTSGTGAVIDGSLVPAPEAVLRALSEHGEADPLEAAVNGGEDYELLFTVPPRRRRALESVIRHAGVPCTRIGAVTAERKLLLRHGGKERPLPGGFAHFR